MLLTELHYDFKRSTIHNKSSVGSLSKKGSCFIHAKTRIMCGFRSTAAVTVYVSKSKGLSGFASY
jgi:hypothetical protein